MEFKDHFKSNDDYSRVGLDNLADQYANVNDDGIVLVEKLIGKLTTFHQLMKLNRTDLLDNESDHQSADQIFEDLEKAQNELNKAIQEHPENRKRNDIYHSAIDWSHHFVEHQVHELEQHEPKSLTLKWYHEHEISHRGRGAGLGN